MPNRRSVDSKKARVIRSIRVEKLFGLYNYHLSTDIKSLRDMNPLMILYGDNGSGKTTVLKLLYHLFAPEQDEGHRSFLAQTPFSLFAVTFNDGASVEVRKVDSSLHGRFEMRINEPSGDDTSILVQTDSEHGVIYQQIEQPEWEVFFGKLNDLGVWINYLDDDRKISTKLQREWKASYKGRRFRIRPKVMTTHKPRPRETDTPADSLIQSTESAARWFRNQAFAASNAGTKSANEIYGGIIKKIGSRQTRSTDVVASEQIDKMVEDLKVIEDKHNRFAALSLTTPLDLSEMTRIFSQLDGEARQLAFGILQPYVNSLEARLKALDLLFNIIDTVAVNLKGLLNGKELSVTLDEGFQVLSTDGKVLPPVHLSSGERQLLLMITSVIASRDGATVFIIDEPELSLNVKWQRRIIDVLMDCAQGSSMQLILATHSLDMAQRYDDCVTPLQSQLF